MKTRLKLWLALTLCLFALLLCAGAMADQYNITTMFPEGTCTAVTVAASTTHYDTTGNLYGVEAGTNVTLEVAPLTGYVVSRVECTYTLDGEPYAEEFVLDVGNTTTMCGFPMPAADVHLTIIMRQEGDIYYPLTASLFKTNCRSFTLQTAGGQSGLEVEAMAGETVTVTAVPENGYDVMRMYYNTMSSAVTDFDFTVDENGVATGSFAMPAEQIHVNVYAGHPEVPYLSYNSSGVSQGELTRTDYQLLTNSSATWYDLSSGWYIARGNVTLSKKTTLRITGDVHLILCDGAKLTAGDGVYIKKGSSLSIYGQSKGTGKLIAKPSSGPGIGGMADTVAGSLYIHGGVIDAKGGTNAAGIGGGNHSSGYENIVIYDGNVTAQGGSSGAGIGKGQQNSPGDCGRIEIYGGTVTATGGGNAAGIGGGEDRDGGAITIHGGTVTATGGEKGAGIGGGTEGTGGAITVYGGTVNSTGGFAAAGIGGGYKRGGGTVTISGGRVTAHGGEYSAGIGGGVNGFSGKISIGGGVVTAYAGESITYGAAIGGGYDADVDSIVISGGVVKAYAQENGAAIGSGYKRDCSGSITVTGGDVLAVGKRGAGIGSGELAAFKGVITISGGTVAASADKGAGIGSGFEDNCDGTIRINGGLVTASSKDGGAGIGAGCEAVAGGGGECNGTIEITGGTVIVSAESGAQGIGHGDDGDDEGTLRLGDAMRVTAGGNSSGSSATLREAGKRVQACRSRYARIEACAEHEASATFVITKDTHAARCVYCNAPMEAEGHAYHDGTCTICGYAGAMVTIHYLPGSDHATGAMSDETCVPNGAYVPADCLFEYAGYEFAGWRLGETETILPAGGEQRFDAETTLTATWRNNWSDLQAAVNAADSGTVIQLAGDTVASVYDSALHIPAGQSIVLDLNGCELNRGLTTGTAYGQVIANYGTLAIMDSVGGGVITGGFNAGGIDGGGITNSGILILDSGTISGNRAASSAGGVRNAAGATFTMTGGSISGNTCGGGGGGAVVNYGTMNLSGGTISGNTSGQNGGGIWSNGTLNLSGGSVTGNTANDKGGGIYARGESTLRLDGSPVITGNTSTKTGANNLYINKDSNKLPTIIAEDLTEDSRIGVSCSVAPTAGTPVVIISGVTGELPQIASDVNAYTVTYENGKLYLAVAAVYTVTVPEGIEHGTVTTNPASCNAGDPVTLTAEAEENYILASLTVTPDGGKAETLLPDAETGAYRFIMPAANVTVSASFIQDKTSAAVQLV